MKNEDFLKEIQEALQEDYPTKLEPNDLRVVIGDVGLHSDDILLEFSVIDNQYNDIQKTVQVYFTITNGYNKEYELEIYRILNHLNQKSGNGHFGIYEPLNQIFFRYNMYFPFLDESSSIITLNALKDVLLFLSIAYDYVIMISDNPIDYTFEDYLKELNSLED